MSHVIIDCAQGSCPKSRVPLCYRGCRMHRIVKGFVVQAGDITKGDGTGGTSIYAGTPLGNIWGHFKDEKFLPHHRAGLLSMANSKPNSNRSLCENMIIMHPYVMCLLLMCLCSALNFL